MKQWHMQSNSLTLVMHLCRKNPRRERMCSICRPNDLQQRLLQRRHRQLGIGTTVLLHLSPLRQEPHELLVTKAGFTFHEVCWYLKRFELIPSPLHSLLSGLQLASTQAVYMNDAQRKQRTRNLLAALEKQKLVR